MSKTLFLFQSSSRHASTNGSCPSTFTSRECTGCKADPRRTLPLRRRTDCRDMGTRPSFLGVVPSRASIPYACISGPYAEGETSSTGENSVQRAGASTMRQTYYRSRRLRLISEERLSVSSRVLHTGSASFVIESLKLEFNLVIHSHDAHTINVQSPDAFEASVRRDDVAARCAPDIDRRHRTQRRDS